MSVYYIVFIILFCADTLFGFFFKSKLTVEKQKRAFCFVAFVLLFLLFALRHQSMGIDLGYWSNHGGYLGNFNILNTYSWIDIFKLEKFLNYERGYIILNKMVGTIYNNRQFFLGVCAFIGLAPIMAYFAKHSTLPYLSVVIYMGLPVFLMQFSGLRQIIAISITILSMKFVEEKKPLRFLLAIWIAINFHKSAFVFVIAYPLYHLRLNDIWKGIFTLVIPIVFIFRRQLFDILYKLFKEEVVTKDTGALTLFLVFSAIYVYLILFNKSSDKNQNGMINLFYVACLTQAFGGIYDTAMRVGYYFMPYLAIAIPNTITSNKDRQEYQTNYVLVLLAFLAYSIYSIKTSTWAMAYPYYFMWE